MPEPFFIAMIHRHHEDREKAGVVCWTCGGFIGRRRGNLRKDTSWWSAVEHLVMRHLWFHEREEKRRG